LTNSLQRNLPISPQVSQLSNRVKKFLTDEQLIASSLWDIIVRLADFRAAMANKGPFSSDYSVPVLLQLDSDLEKWTFGLPSSWTYELRTYVTQGNIYTPFYHRYSGFSIATVWNQYRVARCLVNELLLTYLDASSPASSALHPSSLLEQSDRIKEIIRNICTDICASVPYFFRQTDQNDPQSPGIGAMEVMWALYICASMHCLPEEQRLWTIQQLEKIGYEMWITQALTLANLAKSKIKPVKLRRI
jgi:hypothetical protein